MKPTIIHYMQHSLTPCMIPGLPCDWPDGHKWESDWKLVNCPACLQGREEIQTFAVDRNRKTITCLRCKNTSHNPNDVEFAYCPHCQVFHADIWPPARKWWLEHPHQLIIHLPEPLVDEFLKVSDNSDFHAISRVADLLRRARLAAHAA